jgi:hypothetical protein
VLIREKFEKNAVGAICCFDRSETKRKEKIVKRKQLRTKLKAHFDSKLESSIRVGRGGAWN